MLSISSLYALPVPHMCRASLELPEQRAGELARITELAGKAGVASLASLDAHIKLLQV